MREGEMRSEVGEGGKGREKVREEKLLCDARAFESAVLLEVSPMRPLVHHAGMAYFLYPVGTPFGTSRCEFASSQKKSHNIFRQKRKWPRTTAKKPNRLKSLTTIHF